MVPRALKKEPMKKTPSSQISIKGVSAEQQTPSSASHDSRTQRVHLQM